MLRQTGSRGEGPLSHEDVNTPPPERRWLQITAEGRIGPPFGGLWSHDKSSFHFVRAWSLICWARSRSVTLPVITTLAPKMAVHLHMLGLFRQRGVWQSHAA